MGFEYTQCFAGMSLVTSDLDTFHVLTRCIYQRPEPTSVHEIAIKTLTMLFSKTVDKPEVQREVTTPNLPKFNHTLLNLSGNRDLLVSGNA
jgi:hypothetical protein